MSIGYWSLVIGHSPKALLEEISEPVKGWFSEHVVTPPDDGHAERQSKIRALLKSKP